MRALLTLLTAAVVHGRGKRSRVSVLTRTFVAFLIASGPGVLGAQSEWRSSTIVAHVDHVMFTGGPEVRGLLELLRDKFQLPVIFDGPAQNPPMPGTCFSFGNMCLEIVPLRADPADPPHAPGIRSFALQAQRFDDVVDSLRARGIEHYPPARQPRWTTIGLRGLGGGTFFIQYRESIAQRQQRFRRELDERRGGSLGIVRLAELTRIVDRDRDEISRNWVRLLGESKPGEPYVWHLPGGPAIRLVSNDSLGNRLVVEVRSLANAAEALRRLSIPFVQTSDSIAIDPAMLLGLRVILIAGGPESPPLPFPPRSDLEGQTAPMPTGIATAPQWFCCHPWRHWVLVTSPCVPADPFHPDEESGPSPRLTTPS